MTGSFWNATAFRAASRLHPEEQWVDYVVCVEIQSWEGRQGEAREREMWWQVLRG